MGESLNKQSYEVTDVFPPRGYVGIFYDYNSAIYAVRKWSHVYKCGHHGAVDAVRRGTSRVPVRLARMPSHGNDANWFTVWDYLKTERFTDLDQEVLMFRYFGTQEQIAKAQKRNDPYEWINFIEKAKLEDAHKWEHLTDHGYPDTQGMDGHQAHLARMAHLMTKYPEANWDWLMEQDVFKPSNPIRSLAPRPATPVTESHFSERKARYISLREERQELMASGADPVALIHIVESMATVKSWLENHGVNTGELVNNTDNIVTTVEESALAPVVVMEPKDEETETDILPSPEATISATMTATEASGLIGLTYQTTIKYLASGDIPHGKKVGRNWIVAREPFMLWIADNNDTVRMLALPKVPKTATPVVTPTPTIKHGRRASF